MPLAVLLGAGAALGQAPVGLPWATLLALGLVWHLFVLAETPRRAAWIGWAFGVGYFAGALFWIVEPFFVDIARHGWMAPFALVFTAGGFALFWGGAFALAKWLGRGRWAQAVAFAVALAAVELLRSYLFTGFPWALIGHVWVGWAPMQLAAFVGPVGLTLLTVLAASLAAAAWPHWGRIALVLVPFAALYGLGAWQGARPVPGADDAPVVRLIQPNAPQHQKWDPAYAQQFYARQIAYTAAAGEDGRPDLIVWPETSIPMVLNYADELLANVAEAAGGVPVVLGIQRLEGEVRAYNSLIVLDAAGEQVALYDKYHLVPFGEYLPLSSWFDTVGLNIFGSGYGYSPGPGPRLLDLPGEGLGTVLPLICYEAIFPHDVNAAPARPDWLLQITNDAWFGRVSGPYQHLAQARLRAVEQGLPLVRVANTGVSAVIDARGRPVAALPLNEAGWRDVRLPGRTAPTFYAATGDWAVFAALFLIAAGLWRARRRNGH